MTHVFVKTFSLLGLGWHEITIEADISKSLPTIEIIWLPDAAIKESKERLRATFRNLGVALPPHKIVLNLAPSDIRKIWTIFDLPMAAAILFLIHDKIFHREELSSAMFFGELGLDWRVKRVQWLLPAVIAAKKLGFNTFFVPEGNICELQYIDSVTLYALSSFQDIITHFAFWRKLMPQSGLWLHVMPPWVVSSFPDFSAIRWHRVAKRALSICAAWAHNILLIWAPWSGKTLLSQALPSILPPLQFDEMLEISQIYSLSGKLNDNIPLVTTRPYRAVHHTASKVAITGWWAMLLPWEISLAHKGVLFFDELAEFPREVIEVLRQPMEDKTITISRASWSVTYPAHCMFVAAMNPCKCGYYKDPDKSCVCSLSEIARYQSKISWPLLDRIDMILELPRESVNTLFENTSNTDSASLRSQVVEARHRQLHRYQDTWVSSNAGLSAKHIQQFITLEAEAEDFLKQAANRFHFSWRTIHRMLKLSRTIADVEWSEKVSLSHVAEALHYRSRSMFLQQQ